MNEYATYVQMARDFDAALIAAAGAKAPRSDAAGRAALRALAARLDVGPHYLDLVWWALQDYLWHALVMAVATAEPSEDASESVAAIFDRLRVPYPEWLLASFVSRGSWVGPQGARALTAMLDVVRALPPETGEPILAAYTQALYPPARPDSDQSANGDVTP